MRRWICFWVTVLSVFMIMGYVLQDGKTLEMRKGAYVVFTHRIHTDSTLDTLGWIDSTGIHMRGGWFDSLFAPLAGIADTAYYSWFVNPDSILDSVTFTTDTIRFWRSGSQIGKLELRKVDSSGYSCYSDSANYSDSCFYADTAGSAKYADSALFSYSSEYSDSAAYSDSSLYADSAAWAGLLDGYSEDYFRDTNDVWRDSVHAYQEATDSLATPKIKANFFAPEDSTHMTFLDDIIQLDSDAESLFVSDESGIRLWHDDSVGNSDYGRFLYIYRHAPEGDAYARFGIDAYKYASFYASNGWVFSGGTTLFNCTLLSDKAIRFHANAAGSNIKFNTALGTILDIETLDFSIIHTDASGDTVMVGDTTQYDFNVPIITPYAEIEDSITVGEGGTITKIIKVGSHLAIILGIDTLWAAKDTTGF